MCLMCCLHNQVDPKTDWGGSASESLCAPCSVLSVFLTSVLSVLFHPFLWLYQHMTSSDITHAPHPSEGASPSSSLRSRMVHSLQISSLSMNTTTSQSHHPSEPLLHGGGRTEQTLQHPPRPDPLYVPSVFCSICWCHLFFSLVDCRWRNIGRWPICDVCANTVPLLSSDQHKHRWTF